MNITQCPAFPDWQRATANLTPAQFQQFTFWCWINNQIPNQPAIRQWRAANQA